MLKLVALLIPMSLDTFAVAAALGTAGLSKSMRRRVSLVFVGFETAMPLLGIAIGKAVRDALGGRADYLAGAALMTLGVYLMRTDYESPTGWRRRNHSGPNTSYPHSAERPTVPLAHPS